jgi:hypothetical protein
LYVCKDVGATKHVRVLGFVALAGVVILAGCASKRPARAQPAAGTSRPPATTIVAFHPYDGAGQLSVQVGDAGRGECWTTSIADPVAGAYRCFEGNRILDPCFAPAHPTAPIELACLATPWSDAVMLRVNGSLPNSGPGASPSRPWALELESGVRCVASTGTVPSVHGVDLGYRCTDSGNAAIQSSSGDVVTAAYAAPRSTTLETVSVDTIWRG